MNWHETIEFIREDSAFDQDIEEAYLSADLKFNVEKFRNSEEFKETLELLFSLNIAKNATLLDVGAGNGISSVAFALEGFKITSLEPDSSDTIGAGAIRRLKEEYGLHEMSIVSTYGEEMPFENNSFDLVYTRQCMHHAYDLQEFVKSLYRVVKPGGILLTVRDHVISNESEKKVFLKRHPLHKFYGGENAFTLDEYKNAITDAGFKFEKILAPADSVINYSPWSMERVKIMVKQRLGTWAVNNLVIKPCWWAVKYRLSKLPGRLYSFVAKK